jgi:hypothetical protein
LEYLSFVLRSREFAVYSAEAYWSVFYVSNSYIGFEFRVTYTISRVQTYGILFILLFSYSFPSLIVFKNEGGFGSAALDTVPCNADSPLTSSIQVLIGRRTHVLLTDCCLSGCASAT